MAFSFNPGQNQAPGAPQGGGMQPPTSAVPQAADALPSVPDSPFLFMRNRGQEMTINAYLQMLLVLLSVLALAGSVVLFAYGQYLEISIKNKKEELLGMEESFKSYPFDEMTIVSQRFIAVDKILKTYVSSRSPLKFLEYVVENQAVFNNFSFMNTQKGYVMTFTILTGNYRTLIQQLDALNLKEYSKVAPSAKMNNFNDSGAVFKATVSVPVYVQGVLADEVLFIAPPVAVTGKPSQQNNSSSTLVQ
jgi:hypothetical protein